MGRRNKWSSKERSAYRKAKQAERANRVETPEQAERVRRYMAGEKQEPETADSRRAPEQIVGSRKFKGRKTAMAQNIVDTDGLKLLKSVFNEPDENTDGIPTTNTAR